MTDQIRLTHEEIEAIKIAFKANFNIDDHLWIFGSRVNMQAKGGDIDLYIEVGPVSKEDHFKRQIHFLTDLDFAIGEQKIDVVMNLQTDFWLPIYDVAKKQGIKLV